MWDINDKIGFEQESNKHRGQINEGDFASEIKSFASDTNNKSFLEIGTWNGMGSTKQFMDELLKRDDDYVFYSLECNKEKCEFAQDLHNTNSPRINILNEVIFNEEPTNFYEIFPECKTNEMYKQWNTIDIANMKKCELFLERKAIPQVFDVLLLDGGEFTTYFEFQYLKNRCKYLLLDDINVKKCTLIVKEIEENPDIWQILNKNTTCRNGFLVCRNLKNI